MPKSPEDIDSRPVMRGSANHITPSNSRRRILTGLAAALATATAAVGARVLPAPASESIETPPNASPVERLWQRHQALTAEREALEARLQVIDAEYERTKPRVPKLLRDTVLQNRFRGCCRLAVQDEDGVRVPYLTALNVRQALGLKRIGFTTPSLDALPAGHVARIIATAEAFEAKRDSALRWRDEHPVEKAIEAVLLARDAVEVQIIEADPEKLGDIGIKLKVICLHADLEIAHDWLRAVQQQVGRLAGAAA